MLVKDGIMRCRLCGCGIDKSPLAILESGKARYEALGCEDRHWNTINAEDKGTQAAGQPIADAVTARNDP